MENLSLQIAEHNQKAAEIMENLNQHIMLLPDNPNIKRVGNNAFVMTISKLAFGQIFAPSHYDYKFQYKCIVDALSKSGAENVINKLEKIITEKQAEKVRLHDDVINHLKKLL